MRRLLACLAVAAVACALAVAVAAPAASARQPPVRQVRAALVQRLHAKHLTFRWVACVANGRRYRGQPIVRCNVNFGDPHIEAYCSVLLGRRLVTNHERRAIPCGRDEAGSKIVVVSS